MEKSQSFKRPWFLRHLRAVLAFSVIGIFLICAIFADYITLHHPYSQSLAKRLKPPFFIAKGSFDYPLGTDALGRDLLSRVIKGSRVSLLIGFASIILAGFIGVPLGLLSGYFKGRMDNTIMALADIQLSFPFLLLPIVIAGVLGPSLTNTIFALGIPNWVAFAKVVRGEVLVIRERDFVEAVKALGATEFNIILRTVFPNVISSIVVITTFGVARMIVVEAALSFLGLSVPPPAPTWGGMINDGRDYIYAGWWISVFPGIAITLTVVALNSLGDWLRDLLDPRSRYRLQ